MLPATLALHLGLSELVDRHLDLGDTPGRANTGDKLMTLVASALAGGDCIDDADALRSGGTASVLGCVVKAPSTLGTFLRSFRWGHVRQLDRVSRELLARAWAAGDGPGHGPLIIDIDSTICETYGLSKEGARHHGYTGQRGYHPLLAVAAGTGEVLMARLREGRANTARGAGHFLRETVSRVRYAGAKGQLTVRADSGFYTHAVVSACRKLKVRFSITIRQRQNLRDLIEAIPEADWRPIPYWMEGGADVAEAEYIPFASEPDAAPVRLIVRRVRPTPGSQLALFTNYSYHAFITDREGDTLELEADHRRHAEIENAIRDLKYGVGLNHLPSGRFPANGAWLAVQVMAHNLARWTGRIALGEAVATTKTLRRRFFSLAFITDREGDTLELEADHRRHAEIENAIRDLKYGVGLNHLPSGRFPANGAWLAVQVMAHNLARWTGRIALGEAVATTKTLRRRFFSLAGRITRKARRLILHLPRRWPWETQFLSALARLRTIPLPA